MALRPDAAARLQQWAGRLTLEWAGLRLYQWFWLLLCGIGALAVVTPRLLSQPTVYQTLAAATRRGLWIAPLREIAAWQQARAQVEVVPQTGPPDAQAFTIANRSSHALEGLTLRLPFAATRVLVNGAAVERDGQLDRLVLTLAPRQRLEVQLWR